MQHFGLLLRLIYKRISLFTQHKQNKGRVFRDERPCFLFFHYKKLLHLHRISKLHFMNTLQRLYILLLTLSMCYGCRPDAEGIWQTERNNVTDVTDRIQIVSAAQYDVAMTGTLVPYVIGPYVMITDHNMINGAIHVFRKGDMRYLTSFGKPGGYSGEIAALGHVAWDDVHKEILVADLGHLMIYGFPLDSILLHPDAAPIVRSKLQKSSYPQHFFQIANDQWFSLQMIRDTPTRHKQVTGIFQMKEGTFSMQDYTHPDIDEKRVSLDVDAEHGIYVEANHRYDHLTISSLDGSSHLNIYGPQWQTEGLMHFDDVAIGSNHIYALYNGHPRKKREAEQKEGKDYAQDIIVFSLEGHYIETLHLDRGITHLCCDKENDQLILTFADTERKANQLIGILKC